MKLGAGTCVALGASSLGGCSGEEAAGRSTVRAVTGDSLAELYDMSREAARKIGISGKALQGATIFLKPNLVSMGLSNYQPLVGECTKAEIIAAVAEQCLAAGAAHVTIGEGAQGTSWPWEEIVFLPGNEIHGVTNLAQAVDYLNETYGDRVELACLNAVDRWRFIPSSSNDPVMADGLLVAESFLEADHVISLAVLKAHQWATLTATMKNFVGVMPVRQYNMVMARGKVHTAYAETTCGGIENAGVAGSFIDVVKWRRDEGREDFAILDCTIGLENDAPHDWEGFMSLLPGGGGLTIDYRERTAAGKYFLLAGNDSAAVDSAAARITGYGLDEVKHLIMARNLGLGEIDNIALAGASFDELAVSNWLRAAPVGEWGAPSPAHAGGFGPDAARRSRLLNNLSMVLAPAAMALFLKWLYRRGHDSA